MFSERRFRFNVWILGGAMTSLLFVVGGLVSLMARWHTGMWSDPLTTIIMVAAVWLSAGVLWSLFPTYAGPDGLRATDGVGRYHEVRWGEIESVSHVCGFLWIRHGRLWKALTIPKFLEDARGFRDYVAAHTSEGNPLRTALESR